MRLLLAITIASLPIIAVAGYVVASQRTQNLQADPLTKQETSSENFMLEVILSFEAGVDPFAENLDQATSFLLKLEDRTIFASTKNISAGQSIVIENVRDLSVGNSEFYLEAIPADASITTPKVAKVSIYSTRIKTPLSSSYLWADDNEAKLSGIISLDSSEAIIKRIEQSTDMNADAKEDQSS